MESPSSLDACLDTVQDLHVVQKMYAVQNHERRPMTTTSATRLRPWLLWTLGFLAFPVAGLAGGAVAGPVDDPLAALVGGAVTGLVIGAGQALAGPTGSPSAAGSPRRGSAWRSDCCSAPRSSATAPPSATWRSWAR